LTENFHVQNLLRFQIRNKNINEVIIDRCAAHRMYEMVGFIYTKSAFGIAFL
jgi:hypothetical protein